MLGFVPNHLVENEPKQYLLQMEIPRDRCEQAFEALTAGVVRQRKLRPMTTFRTYYTLYCVIQSSLIKSIKIIEYVTGCSLLEALILPKYNIKDVRIFFTKHWSKIGGSNQFSIQN